MNEKNLNQSTQKITYKGIGMASGLVFGGVVGLLAGNMIVFAGGGMVLGLAIGHALDNRGKQSDS